jgi:hypothetical protein
MQRRALAGLQIFLKALKLTPESPDLEPTHDLGKKPVFGRSKIVLSHFEELCCLHRVLMSTGLCSDYISRHIHNAKGTVSPMLPTWTLLLLRATVWTELEHQ